MLRSNWPIYLEEMNTAVIGVMDTYFLRDNRNDCILDNNSENLSSDRSSSVNTAIASAVRTTTTTAATAPQQIWPIKMFPFNSPDEPMTHFERKYANSTLD